MIEPEIGVAELKAMRDAGRDFVLLDVRRPDELEIAQLDWAVHVPMDEIPERIGEVPQDRDVVVMCHGGTRSGRVAAYLRSNGFTRVANLEGGIDAWAREIDPSLATY